MGVNLTWNKPKRDWIEYNVYAIWNPTYPTYGLYPSHDALQAPTLLLGVVTSVCTPLPTRTQQLPTMLAQQCWEPNDFLKQKENCELVASRLASSPFDHELTNKVYTFWLRLYYWRKKTILTFHSFFIHHCYSWVFIITCKYSHISFTCRVVNKRMHPSA